MRYVFLPSLLAASLTGATIADSERTRVFVDNGELHYAGALDQGANERLFALYDGLDEKPTRLAITSAGGDVEVGLDLGEWLYAKGLDVRVPAYCLSSRQRGHRVHGVRSDNRTQAQASLRIFSRTLHGVRPDLIFPIFLDPIFPCTSDAHVAHQSRPGCQQFLRMAEIRAAYIRSKTGPPVAPTLNEVLRLISGLGGFLARKGCSERACKRFGRNSERYGSRPRRSVLWTQPIANVELCLRAWP